MRLQMSPFSHFRIKNDAFPRKLSAYETTIHRSLWKGVAGWDESGRAFNYGIVGRDGVAKPKPAPSESQLKA